jgi:YegS/Rv2252/BmrU family lipid kinase
MERLALIANPTAGVAAGRGSRHRLIAAAQNELERSGFQVALQQSQTPEEVTSLAIQAIEAGIARIVVAGGDGTINCVVNGLMQWRQEHGSLGEITLGVVPIGTGNVFAYNMGIPREWRQACRVIRANHKRSIDVGLASHTPTNATSTPITKLKTRNQLPITQSRYFLLMAGIGYDAKVIEDTSLRLKFVLRDFAYALRSLQNVVLHQGTQITLRFDDGRLYANEAWLVMIGNAASYAWDIKVTKHAELDDGLLDICLMPFENKFISVQQAMQILMGQHIERGIAQYWQSSGVTVESTPPVPVQLDGDAWATTPVEIKILPAALNVFVPESEI